MSFERKLRLQIIATVVLVLTGMAVSKLPVNKKISSLLYTTYDFETVINTFEPAFRVVREGSRKIALVYNGEVNSIEKNLGVQVKSDATGKASAKESTPVPAPTEEKHAAAAKWTMPVNGEISSPYGMRVHPVDGSEAMHNGMDIAAAEGESVYAASSGVVIKADYDDANGNYVKVKHGEDITTFYAHLSKITVNEGDEVSRVVKIGEVGSTGISTGPHLHFEVAVGGKSVDPALYLKDDLIETPY